MVGFGSDDLDAILTYVELVRTRSRLRDGDALTTDELKAFAGSLISPRDVMLLRNLMSTDTEPDVAADAMFFAYTHGGIGSLHADMRGWLEKEGIDVTSMGVTAATLLAAWVRDLYDGTALRELFEYSYQEDVKMVLAQILEDSDSLPLDDMLRQNTLDQIQQLTERQGAAPSNRFLWVLRTYLQHEHARRYLLSFASQGRVAAVASYALSGDLIDWEMIYAAEPQDEFDMRLVVNVALDNVARGADARGRMHEGFLAGLSASARNEFMEGLALLEALPSGSLVQPTRTLSIEMEPPSPPSTG